MTKALYLLRLHPCARPRHRCGPATGVELFSDTNPPLAESYILVPEGGEATARVAALVAQIPLSTLKAGRRQGDRVVNSFRVTVWARLCSERRRPAAPCLPLIGAICLLIILRRFGV